MYKWIKILFDLIFQKRLTIKQIKDNYKGLF